MKLQAKLYRAAVYAGAAFSVSVLVLIVGYILVKGIPHLSPELFAWEYNSTNVSMMPSIINTLLMTLLSLLVCVPLGIGAAIWLTEYAPRGSRLVKLVRMTAETLSGIPSIIYGLFGALFFVVALNMKLSLLSGALTLSIMVLPSAIPGILSGVILAIGRIVGETAALIYTAGTVPEVPDSLLSSTRTLAVHMYTISTEGLYIDQSYATAVVLLDIMLPGEDGLSLLRFLRENHRTAETPVIMLTAKGTEMDKVQGLDYGADDYMVKPFGLAELVARIRARLRRTGAKVDADTLKCGGLTIDRRAHKAFVDGAEMPLTLKEYDLLLLLMENTGAAFTREQLLERIWDMAYDGGTRTVDVHVQTLRTKMGRCGHMIETVRGVGYRFGGGEA